MTAPPGRPRRRRGAMPTASEDAFTRDVLTLADYGGWLAYHTYDSRRSRAGFPDLVLVRAPRLIFAELKAHDDEAAGRRVPLAELDGRPEWLRRRDVTTPQAQWLEALTAVAGAIRPLTSAGSVEVYLWTPRDLQDIADTLARGGELDPEAARAWAANRHGDPTA